jgi:DnaJ-class molecular chaperone
MERMTAFVALNGDTPIEVDVERLGGGAGRIRCPECDGSGNLSHFPPGTARPGPCVDCKGTGLVLVSV